MKIKIMELGVPNKNGRLYSAEVMAKAAAKAKFPLLIDTNREAPTLVSAAGFAYSLNIEGADVMAECTFTNADIGQQVASGALHVVPAGIGTVLPDGTVANDYMINYLFVTDDPA